MSRIYLTQLENDLSSQSMDTFFSILEVTGYMQRTFSMRGQKRRSRSAKRMPGDDGRRQAPNDGHVAQSDSSRHGMEPVILGVCRCRGRHKQDVPAVTC